MSKPIRHVPNVIPTVVVITFCFFMADVNPWLCAGLGLLLSIVLAVLFAFYDVLEQIKNNQERPP